MVMHRDDAPAETTTSRSADPEVVNRYSGTGVTGTIVGLAVLALAAVFLLAQNTEKVPFEFLWLDGDVPLYVLFLVTALAASLATVLASAIWRRRRRQMRNEHEELQRLRQRAG
jgi:uncharacterized integral membrane protein